MAIRTPQGWLSRFLQWRKGQEYHKKTDFEDLQGLDSHGLYSSK